MIIYATSFSVAAIFLLFSSIFKKNRAINFTAIIPLILLCLITGTRYYMGGYDIYNYADTFNSVPYLSDFHLLTMLKTNGIIGSEVGYQLLNSFVKTLGFNFFGFTLIISIFFYVCVYVGMSKFSTNMNLVVVVLMYKAFLGLAFVYMRQCIAVGIFLISLKYIYESKPIKYVLLILLASTMHFTAIFLLPCYLLKKIKLTRKKIIIYSVLFTASYLFALLNINLLSHITVIENLFSGSAQEKIGSVAGENSLYQGGTNILHLLEFLVLDISLILNFNKIKLKEKESLMIKLFLCILPFYSMFANEGILIRLPFYFLLSYPVIIEYLARNRSLSVKLIIYIIVIIISFLGMYKFAVDFDAGAMYVYKSFLAYHLSIFE